MKYINIAQLISINVHNKIEKSEVYAKFLMLIIKVTYLLTLKMKYFSLF